MDSIEIETGGHPVGSVIWLHGLGADGHDFEPIVPELRLPPSLALRFIFPNAPVRPVTLNGGMPMRAWYDIDPASPLAGGDDIHDSAQEIAALIEIEMGRGISAERVILAGFSQGGVIALHLALRYPQALGGVMGLSTYLDNPDHLAAELSLANTSIPIFLAHGTMDPMIPIHRAAASRDQLLALNYDVEWHEYPMGHQVCPEEIRHISHWLQARFSAA